MTAVASRTSESRTSSHQANAGAGAPAGPFSPNQVVFIGPLRIAGARFMSGPESLWRASEDTTPDARLSSVPDVLLHVQNRRFHQVKFSPHTMSMPQWLSGSESSGEPFHYPFTVPLH